MTFSVLFWFWAAALFLGFLPVELYAAIAKRAQGGTFSEFVWWTFGVKARDGALVRWALARRLILAGMCVSLTAHFVFGLGPLGVEAFGVGVAAVIVRSIGWERRA